jgi:2,3-dihydroxyphenylpropionate 1,2-dioxygenase
MAQVVYGFAASHDPSVAVHHQVQNEMTSPYARFRAALDQARQHLVAARPDTLVIFSNDHSSRATYDLLPTFTVSVGVEATGTADKRLVRQLLPAADASGELRVPNVTIKVDQALGQHFMAEGMEHGFDFASSHASRLEHGETIPLTYLTPDYEIPIVNIVTNVFFPPIPSLRRCRDLGRFVRAAIESWDVSKRVAVFGVGGLAHWVGGPESGRLNTEFDQWFMDALLTGKLEQVIERYPSADGLGREIGNGGQEIRNWVAAAGAIPGTLTPRKLAYEPAMAIGLGAIDWTANQEVTTR